MNADMSDQKPIRQIIHNHVKSGDVLGAITEAGKMYGFDEFHIFESGPPSNSISSKGNIIAVGLPLLYDLVAIAGTDAGLVEKHTESGVLLGCWVNADQLGPLVEKYIEKNVEFIAGYDFAPRQPMRVEKGKTKGRVPYSCSEITKCQERIGMASNSEKALSPRRSQALLYSAVECHKDRDTVDELMEVIAADIWVSSIYANYAKLERNASEATRRKFIRRMAYDYSRDVGYSWLKTNAVAELIGKVADIDKRYQSRLLGDGKAGEPFILVVDKHEQDAAGEKDSEVDKEFHATDRRKARSGK